jgi:hypothetical protein
MTKNRSDTPLSDNLLLNSLKAKSRRRREQLAALTAAPPPPSLRNDLVPRLALIERAPADLIIPIRNIRKVAAAHLREVATAISSLGFCAPVLIDQRNAVLDGVVRVEAAKLLGLTLIPCIRADHLNLGTPASADGTQSPERKGQLGF